MVNVEQTRGFMWYDNDSQIAFNQNDSNLALENFAEFTNICVFPQTE